METSIKRKPANASGVAAGPGKLPLEAKIGPSGHWDWGREMLEKMAEGKCVS